MNLWKAKKSRPKITRFQCIKKLLFVILCPVVSCSTIVELIQIKLSSSFRTISLRDFYRCMKLKFAPFIFRLRTTKYEVNMCSYCLDFVMADLNRLTECKCKARYCSKCVQRLRNLCNQCNEQLYKMSSLLVSSEDEIYENDSDNEFDYVMPRKLSSLKIRIEERISKIEKQELDKV